MRKMRWILLMTTATALAVTAIVFKQSVIRILPLFVSLFIMLLQTKASRFAYLLGGANSILYAISYYTMALYGSALYAFCISFPLQMITFICWSKRAYGNSTRFRRLSNKQRLVWGLGGVMTWGILYCVLSLFGSPYVILDNTVTIIGIVATFFCMLALIEFQFLQLAGGLVSCVLYITMLRDDPAQITYLIYTVYSMICCTLSWRCVCNIYQKQQEELQNENGMGQTADRHQRPQQ